MSARRSMIHKISSGILSAGRVFAARDHRSLHTHTHTHTYIHIYIHARAFPRFGSQDFSGSIALRRNRERERERKKECEKRCGGDGGSGNFLGA